MFLINNKYCIKNQVKSDEVIFKKQFNLLKFLTMHNIEEYKALNSLFLCSKLLKNLKKTIFIYNDNYIVLLFNNNMYDDFIIYKFENIELSYVVKLYTFSKASIFINASSKFIKFKTEHERFLTIFLDCLHHRLSRKKINLTNLKMFLIVLFNLMS